MGKSKKKFLTKLRPQKQSEHWLGHGLDGQEALLFDLDPYLYALDAHICRVSQQIAFSTDARVSKPSKERPKAAIILGDELNPWSIGFLSEKFDLVLVTDFIDPIVEETADHFNAIILDEEKFYNLEPVIDFALFFNCSAELGRDLIKSAFDITNILAIGGVALFPTRTTEILGAEVRANWLSTTLGFKEFDSIEVFQTSFSELLKTPDYGVGEFAKRHKSFYGKEARDLCLKRIYEDDFQEVVKGNNEILELIVGYR